MNNLYQLYEFTEIFAPLILKQKLTEMQNIWWTMKITTNTMTNEIWHDLKPIFVCYITI